MASKFGFTLTLQPKNVHIDRIDQIGVVVGDYIEESAIPEVVDIIGRAAGARKGESDEAGVLVVPRLYHRVGVGGTGVS